MSARPDIQADRFIGEWSEHPNRTAGEIKNIAQNLKRYLAIVELFQLVDTVAADYQENFPEEIKDALRSIEPTLHDWIASKDARSRKQLDPMLKSIQRRINIANDRDPNAPINIIPMFVDTPNMQRTYGKSKSTMLEARRAAEINKALEKIVFGDESFNGHTVYDCLEVLRTFTHHSSSISSIAPALLMIEPLLEQWIESEDFTIVQRCAPLIEELVGYIRLAKEPPIEPLEAEKKTKIFWWSVPIFCGAAIVAVSLLVAGSKDVWFLLLPIGLFGLLLWLWPED